MILALQVLTPLCKYIPKSALSAVIISAVIQMVDYKIVKKLWQVRSKYFMNGELSLFISKIFPMRSVKRQCIHVSIKLQELLVLIGNFIYSRYWTKAQL